MTASTTAQPPVQQAHPVVCPYCGADVVDPTRCVSCGGLFEPLSRQATQNAMGPWQMRDERTPFSPPFSFETLRTMIARKRITLDSVIRGPSTRQFWMRARHVPGVSALLGCCHACGEAVDPRQAVCESCGVGLTWPHDRERLGLMPLQPLPGSNDIPAGLPSNRAQPDRPQTDTGSGPMASQSGQEAAAMVRAEALALARRRNHRLGVLCGVLMLLCLLLISGLIWLLIEGGLPI